MEIARVLPCYMEVKESACRPIPSRSGCNGLLGADNEIRELGSEEWGERARKHLGVRARARGSS
jgi:hypothetical protein